MADIIAYPGVQQWWRTREHWYTDEFRGVVEAVIERGAGKGAYLHYGVQAKAGEAPDSVAPAGERIRTDTIP